MSIEKAEVLKVIKAVRGICMSPPAFAALKLVEQAVQALAELEAEQQEQIKQKDEKIERLLGAIEEWKDVVRNQSNGLTKLQAENEKLKKALGKAGNERTSNFIQ